MRLDEFSAPSGIDGALNTTELARFILFGFDIALDAPEDVETYVNYALSVVERDPFALSVVERDPFALSVVERDPYTLEVE